MVVARAAERFHGPGKACVPSPGAPKLLARARRVVAFVAAALLLHGCGTEGREARQALSAGEAALRGRDLRGALGHFREAAAQAPRSPNAHTRRGDVADRLGEFQEALEAYETAARLSPSATRFFRVAAVADRMGETAMAVEWLKASLASAPAPRSGGRLNPLRQLLFGGRVSRQDVTERLFQIYLESGDETAALHLARSEGWVIDGADYCDKPLLAVSPETQALLAMVIRPQDAGCLVSLGMSLTEGGAVRLARRVLLSQVRHAQDPRVRERARTFLRARLPQHDVAKLAETLNAVGYNLQYGFRKPEEALAVFRSAMAADPAFAWPYNNTGNVLAKRGRQEEALEWFRKATAVNPDYWRAYLNLGATLMDLKRYQEALPAFERALPLLPEHWESHSNLGRTLLSLGRKREGIRELVAALRLNPENRPDAELLDERLGVDPRRGPTPYAARCGEDRRRCSGPGS